MKLFNKQNLTKIVMASALILPISSLSAHGAQAAIVPNTKTICHVNKATKVYDNYKKGKHATGQVLGANTSWKIIKTAKTKKGVTWYDLGKNQWIKAPKLTYTAQVVKSQAPVSQAPVSQAPQAPTQNTQTYQVQTQPTQQQLTQISSNAVQATTQIKHQKTYAANSNSSANYIASRESGGSYSARNGQYIGKYQLSASYLHGDYSPANQERVARQYAISRYGSWQAAANFHRTHGWW